MEKYVILAVTENHPGVLSRMTGLLRRKMFNIDSLTVGKTTNPRISRFTIVILGNEKQARKIARNIENFIEVIEVHVMKMDEIVSREISLVRVKADSVSDPEVLFVFPGVEVKERLDGDEIELEVIDRDDQTDNFMQYLLDHDVLVEKWVRSGVIAV